MSAVNPTITVVAPTGAAIGTQMPYQATVFLDPSNGNITRIIVMVEFANSFEVAFCSGAFTEAYNGLSSLIQAGGTFTLSLIRNGGWPTSPRVLIHANTDAGGMTQ